MHGGECNFTPRKYQRNPVIGGKVTETRHIAVVIIVCIHLFAPHSLLVKCPLSEGLAVMLGFEPRI